MMASAFSKAVGQLGDPAFRRVLGWTLLLTASLFVLLALGTAELVDRLPEYEESWMNWTVGATAVIVYLFAAWLLFPAAATAIMGLFLDDAAEAVELKHYASDPPGVALGMGHAFWEALKLGLVILGVNIAALPLYLFSMMFPMGPVILFYLINSYLLGREYFELVAMRHLRPPQAKRLRRINRGAVTLHGLPIAVAFSIPILNLLAPLFGTAYMMHIFKALNRQEARS